MGQIKNKKSGIFLHIDQNISLADGECGDKPDQFFLKKKKPHLNKLIENYLIKLLSSSYGNAVLPI